VLTAALVLAAALAGVAGSWSPCGLSMIDTVRRQRVAIAAFAVGAAAGGVITFGGLAVLGDALGAGGAAAAAVAVAALLVAALGDAAGRRIVPQVRRQVPESWRRILPVPMAAGLYGVLLGLGFTTFLLTFATWALAAACLAVGTPATGALVGLAFGAGRALPVAVLALREDGAALLGERPGLLRGLRGAVAAALVACAAVLAGAPPAARAATATPYAYRATDPSAAGSLLAYQRLGGRGVLVRGGETVTLPGTHPAVAGGRVAWIDDGAIVVARAATLDAIATIPAPGADALALSATHVLWRSGQRLRAVALAAPEETPVLVASADGRESVGRPTLDGATAVFALQSRAQSRIFARNLATGAGRRVRQTTGALLLEPTRVDGRLLYVRSTSTRQQLVLGRRVIWSTTPTARRDKGHEDGHTNHHQGYPHGIRPRRTPRPGPGVTVTLWTTALKASSAFVTRLRHRPGGRTDARILRVRF
jgi:hypothetical protein